jgi:hypothetical protein
MSNFGEKVRGTLAFQTMAGEVDTTSTITHIPLNRICCRYQNKYINNIDKHKALRESIRVNGLIEPIIVLEIDEYLKNDVTEGEINYLNSKKAKGCKYFISSGHRRFKAYASLAVGRDLYSDEDLDCLYTEGFSSKYSQWKNKFSSIDALMSDSEEDSWFEIPAKIIEYGNETAIYNDSNTTQREITSFEIIDNTIDELKKDGTWNDIIQNVKTTRVDSMSDRAVRDNIKLLVAKGIIGDSGTTKIEELRTVLKGMDIGYIPGTENILNKDLAEIITSRKQRDISVTSVKVTRQIIEKFSPEMIKCIYDGKLSFRSAKELLPVYDELDIGEAVEQINAGKFEVEKAKKRKKIRFTERQLIDLIYDIKNGNKTVDEVIALINQ